MAAVAAEPAISWDERELKPFRQGDIGGVERVDIGTYLPDPPEQWRAGESENESLREVVKRSCTTRRADHASKRELAHG